MKTNHKPKKASKKSKGSKKSSRRSKKGLHGTKTAARAKGFLDALVETGKQASGVGIGLLTSAAIGYGLDQIEALKPNPSDGKMKAFLRAAAKPAGLVIVGTGVSSVARMKNVKFAANIGDGIIGGGLLSAANKIVGDKSAIFKGLGAADGEASAQYYQETIDALQKNLAENGKVIPLRGIDDAPLADKVIIPGSEIQYASSNAIV